MITLRDPTLNEIYKHLFHDDTLPRGRMKKWTDRLTEVDTWLQLRSVEPKFESGPTAGKRR